MRVVDATATVTLSCIVAIAAGLPAQASCTASMPIASFDPLTQQRSLVYTPGSCLAGAERRCEGGPHYGSVTGKLKGFFWALGNGDPRPGYGIDNGTFLPGYPGPSYPEVFYARGPSSWLQTTYYAPAEISSSWSSSPEIDGCPDTLPDRRCTAILLTDVHEDETFFAFLTSQEKSSRYSFARPLGEPIDLARLPAPRVTDSKRLGESTVRITVKPPFDRLGAAPDGFFEDPACDFGEPIGWKIHQRNLEGHDDPPPSERNVSGWRDISGALAFDGRKRTLEADCIGDQDIYLAFSLSFDSGFETPYVSAPSRKIECGPGARAGGTRIGWLGWSAIAGGGLAALWAFRLRARRRSQGAAKGASRVRAYALATLAVSIVVSLGLAELAVRRWGDHWPYREAGSVVGLKTTNSRSDYLPSTVAPDMTFLRRTREFDVVFRTNAEGFRDDAPLTPVKPPGEFRILLCGDSFTWGQGAAFDETYGEVAERELNRDDPARYRVINAGYRSGYTLDHYLAFLERESDRFSPDHVVIQIYTGNDFEDMQDNHWEQLDDAGLPRRIRSRRRYTDHEGRFVEPLHYDPPLPHWLRDSRLAVVLARAVTGRYAVLEPTPTSVVEQRIEMAITAIHDHAERNNRRLTWIVVPSLRRERSHERMKAHSIGAIRTIGDDLIDLEGVLEQTGEPWSEFYFPVDGHLNARGNRLLGGLLARHVETRIGDGVLPTGP